MRGKKKQVLFIGRKIWGGGAEKVMYYLSQRLDSNIFEPHVAHMIRQDDAPVVYDPSIPVTCVDDSPVDQQPVLAENAKSKFSQYVLNKVPANIKSVIKSIVNKQTTDLRKRLNPESVLPPEKMEVLAGLGNLSQSIATHITYSYGYKKILSKLREDTIIVAFQEEPTVQAWLNQINDSYSFFSYLCAPESIHLPLLYPAPQKLSVEKWLFSNACRAANYVTVPNTWMRDDMISEFSTPQDNIKIVPNPIDCDLILRKSELPLDIDLELGGKTVFVQLARLDKQKNHILTLRACEILKEKLKNFVILLIGDGSERQMLEKMTVEKKLQNHIVFLGEKSNPYPYLKIARASILTSDFEASPLALMDAMLLGAVPISVDCVCGPSDILGDGLFGMLVPPNDPDKLATAMCNIALDDELWGRLKKSGMRHALSFDVSVFVDTWTKMLLEPKKISKRS
ncbi:MAG: glycosyltransferase [Anaerolineae bacterium]|jgi:glycosyltransferase involved in cell wall biosynthesis|nr:glycosyltransferase [Anaerolineae bacterium]